MNDTQILLEAHQLGRRHKEGWLLQDINLQIHGGERLAIVGPSGAGKTLLLRALSLLDPLDAGVVQWKSGPIAAAAVPDFRRQAVYLHQRPALLEGTVEDNLRLPFSLRSHHDSQFSKELALSLFAELGRDAAFLTKDQRYLSGGESQLVALVRALQLSPSLLFLDEPTSALDPATTTAVEKLLARWQRQGDGTRSLVWVSHDAQQIERMVGRKIGLQNGRMEAG
jgi:putative ABC transport system ATP-binding protein